MIKFKTDKAEEVMKRHEGTVFWFLGGYRCTMIDGRVRYTTSPTRPLSAWSTWNRNVNYFFSDYEVRTRR